MPSHRFLSDEWIAEVRHIQDGHSDEPDAPITPIRMNLVVNAMPFGPSSLDAHIDTSSGQIVIDLGHLESADVTVHLNYDLAKAILVNGDGQAAIGAFFTRKLRVDGDMSKLLAFQAIPPSARQAEITEQIRAMTV